MCVGGGWSPSYTHTLLFPPCSLLSLCSSRLCRLLPGSVIQTKQPKPWYSLQKWRSLCWPFLGEPQRRLLVPNILYSFQWNSSLCFYWALFLLGTQTCFHGPGLVTGLNNSSPKLLFITPHPVTVPYWASLSNSTTKTNSVLGSSLSPMSAGFFQSWLTSFTRLAQTCLNPSNRTSLDSSWDSCHTTCVISHHK